MTCVITNVLGWKRGFIHYFQFYALNAPFYVVEYTRIDRVNVYTIVFSLTRTVNRDHKFSFRNGCKPRSFRPLGRDN